ncbi:MULTISPECIES: tetratricopeptide repeat protein [unclassified Streptomyces]|uniref:tetratricopeptide repeat protein n=1 Tax=unclassified Streptomyces TaxID=2593676 RepID=UPI0023654512|nr:MULTISPECIES: tetratricopeptide repeat protein [unclassified Streptomyces]MDF3142173.1 tetratricopeptide repeat protein [Streptomyces sp. T21Q-yed]WDF43071.1 tetratricopeptide repeat protein [Streptomyces sp. T12]
MSFVKPELVRSLIACLCSVVGRTMNGSRCSAEIKDAEVAYQTAWVHDVLGLEAEAVPFYVGSLGKSGLSQEDRRGALLGLGSTYRTLGRHTQAVDTLRQGAAEFPDDGALQTFLAMALFNTNQHHEAMQILLKLLATTSEDPYVRQYRRAIETYAQDLNDTV